MKKKRMCTALYEKNKLQKTFFIKQPGEILEKYVKKLHDHISAEDLKNYKPVGLTHLNHLSKVLRRTIQVWSKDRLIYSSGKRFDKPEINVEFEENKLGCSQTKIGHYSLKGGKEPFDSNGFPNDCLYNVVSTQTGLSPKKLRTLVTRNIRKKLKNYPAVRYKHIKDLRGGAMYRGKNRASARRVLDNSQKGQSHPDKQLGHPRGHASAPKIEGFTNSVENYSKCSNKTAFLSRDDQDVVANLALRTSDAQDVFELMNDMGEHCFKKVLKLSPDKLAKMEKELPKAQDWLNGKRNGRPGRICELTLVFKHFYEKYNSESADPFVLTFYPSL